MSEAIIIAPHPDDEIIGCYEILKDRKCAIIYSGDTSSPRREEAMKMKDYFENVSIQLFLASIPQPFLNKGNTFYFPDPINEIHPLHRQYGYMGEMLARAKEDVIFYSTLMNVPYIHEVDPEMKEHYLDMVYPSQKALWKYEKKFILFEGRCKWIF